MVKKIWILSITLCCSLYGMGQTAQFSNPGFEEWAPTSIYEDPDNWMTVNFLLVDVFNMAPGVNKVPGHSGNHAAKITTTDTSQYKFPGTLFYENPFSARPDSLGFYYKLEFSLLPSDSAEIFFYLKSGGANIATIYHKLYVSKADWTYLSLPVNYSSSAIPDTIGVFFSVGTQKPGSTHFYLDDVSLKYSNLGIGESDGQTSIRLSPNPAKDIMHVTLPYETPIEIYDAFGKHIESIPPRGTTVTINTSAYANGIYFLRTRGATQKFIVHN